MDTREHRRENLGRLLDERGAARKLADRLGIQPAYVSQMKLGHRPVSEAHAREIERMWGLEPYSLDSPGMKPPAGTGPVDSGVLGNIIGGVIAALESSGLNWPPMRIGRLASRLYAVYQKTGAYPKPEQVVLLVDPEPD